MKELRSQQRQAASRGGTGGSTVPQLAYPEPRHFASLCHCKIHPRRTCYVWAAPPGLAEEGVFTVAGSHLLPLFLPHRADDVMLPSLSAPSPSPGHGRPAHSASGP